MVKNLRGGNKTKKSSSKKVVKNLLPSEEELYIKGKYTIAKITNIYNNKHAEVITLNKNSFSVFCSAANSVSRLIKDNYVLIYYPNIEYHSKKTSEKYKSIIVCNLDMQMISALVKKYKMEFVEKKEDNMEHEDCSVMFENEFYKIEEEEEEENIDIDEI